MQAPVWKFVQGDIRERAIIAANPKIYSEEGKQKETISVIVLSYNRPKMLKEALESVGDADEIIITDDGSDFDPADTIKELDFKMPVKIIKSKPASLEIRLNQPRLGKMLNAALANVSSTLVTYLCDDDIMGPGWLSAVKEWMYDRPACHIVKGDYLYFKDDIKDTRKVALDGRGMSTGNFVHRIECYKDEKIYWYEHRLDSIDDSFFWEIHKHHNTWMIPYINWVALYRRVHPKALSTYCVGYETEDDGMTLKARINGGISQEGKNKLNNDKWME